MGGRRDEKLNSEQVRQMLQRSAGLCEFENCAQPLFFDLVSGHACNDGQYAHIIPSSADGPRGGGDETLEYIASVANRMHLCHKHHEIVDHHVDKYPAHLLRQMKRKHEDHVAAFRLMLKKTPIMPILFSSDIKGRQTTIDYGAVCKAIRDDARPLQKELPCEMRIDSSADYGSPRYWEETRKRVTDKVARLLDESRAVGEGNVEYGIFPLAPMPLIVLFGWLIGDKLPMRVYQLLRDDSAWSWNRDRPINRFSSKLLRAGASDCKRIAISFSLSFETGKGALENEDESVPVYVLMAERQGVDCIAHREDLNQFRDVYYSLMDGIQKRHGSDVEVYIYPSLPVSAAFEIGRRYMPGVFPKFHIMENMGDGKWVEACEVGK